MASRLHGFYVFKWANYTKVEGLFGFHALGKGGNRDGSRVRESNIVINATILAFLFAFSSRLTFASWFNGLAFFW
jgi:hypothetical protein